MSKGCRVCGHVAHERIDRALASGQSPASLGRAYRGLSRRQIREHKERCLANSPLLVHALRAGDLTYEHFDGLLRAAGKSGEEAGEIVDAVRGHLEEAS